MTNVPKRYAGLHNHCVFSPFDGLGYPNDHFDWCIENGLDAHAITDHGNMNAYAHSQLHIEKWNKENPTRPFKYIPGCEFYFHPDLDQWRKDKEHADQVAADAKLAKKEAKKLKEKLVTPLERVADEDDETLDITNQLTIENEEESKSNKYNNPVNRRHHLVLLPKNQRGLQRIFSLVSQGYLKGFYRFPRIDLKMLKEACKDGDIVASSACIAGFPAWSVFREVQDVKFDELKHTLLDDKALLERCVANVGNVYEMMVSAFGEGNYFLELQFNRLPAQNLVNRAIIEFAGRNGLSKQLVVTCDAHYARPELWKERELYKKLGYLNYKEIDSNSLPKSKAELKCELYPKNAEQLWEEYKLAKEGTSFYDDDVICQAIERTHDIAHQVIGDVPPDRTPKFPNEKLIPAGEKSFQHLVKLCMEGLKKRGLQGKEDYVTRLKEELGVIKEMKNADYFISYQKIMELARGVCLVGPGRGSGGGSLVAYVLYITDLDPLKWDLPFARFLSVYRKGAPDIDCVHQDHLVLMSNKQHRRAIDIKVGDSVIGGDGFPHQIIAVYARKLRENEVPIWVRVQSQDGTLGDIFVVPGHKFVKVDGEVVYCRDLKVGDELMASSHVVVTQIDHDQSKTDDLFVDVTVEGDHRFNLVPFNVYSELEHRISYCLLNVSGTFVMCGEGGNHCSGWCETISKFK